MTGPNLAPLLSWRGAALAVVLATVLCWPMFLTGGSYGFPDTKSYLRGGEVIWSILSDVAGRLTTEAPSPAAGGDSVQAAMDTAAGDDGRGPIVIRSVAYSFFSYSLYAIGGALLLAVAQGALAVFSAFGFVGPLSGYRVPVLLAGSLVILFATSLPWFSVYMMPDIFAALIILHAAILLGRFDDLSTTQKVVFTMIAAFATAAHYGNPPLALGLFSVAILWRLFSRRWSNAALVAAIVPVLLTPLSNLTVSWATLDRPSTAPLRLPILLARSLEDGPARWYLEDACPEADLAVCALFQEGSPANIREFLWSERGIEGLPRETVLRIVDEEYRVLLQAFLAYPVQQTASLLENAVSQLTMIGLDEVNLFGEIGPDLSTHPPDESGGDARLKQLAETAITMTTWGSLVLFLLAWASGRTVRGDVEVVAMVVLGFVLNALVFGGLSAPADRYQARISWLLPVMVLLILARRRSRVGG